jgi:hypothetical protein
VLELSSPFIGELSTRLKHTLLCPSIPHPQRDRALARGFDRGERGAKEPQTCHIKQRHRLRLLIEIAQQLTLAVKEGDTP